MSFKINGDQGIGPIGGLKGTRKADSSKKAKSGSPKDTVEFSSVLQEANRTQESRPAGEVNRQEKLQALKEQIAEGSYRPDSTKVAASLLKFLAEGK
jgi:negative regulator of flagellin synthesis FlgM